MRPIQDTAAPEAPLLAFGNGLRDRLEVVRAAQAARIERARRAPRRDISPELMLVSPDPDPAMGGLLAEALLERVRDARRAPLGMLLAEAGLLGADEIHFALARAQESGQRLGEVLVQHGFVTPDDIVRVVAEQRGLPFLDVRNVSVDPAAAKLLPEDLARLFRTLPVGFVRGLPVGRHRVEGVAAADDARDERDVVARKPVRIAEPVVSLVARTHDVPDLAEQAADLLEHALALDRVLLDDLALLVGQRAGLVDDLLRRSHLADVVQQRRELGIPAGTGVGTQIG